MTFCKAPPDPDPQRGRARALGLYGVVAAWEEVKQQPWLEALLDREETERKKRSLERRIAAASLGRFKAAADFDWAWPKRLDRVLCDELFTLGFVREGANVIVLGPNGVGKTTLAKNLAYQAVLAGHTVRCTTASDRLHDLAKPETSRRLATRLGRYSGPQLLVIDEVGYLSYDNRYADLLFEVITRRYEQSKSIVLTTNKPFGEWAQVFPNAACVVTLVDRLMHRAELLTIEADSYRLREANERAARRAMERKAASPRASR